MTSIASHPQRNSIRVQLRQNVVLRCLGAPFWDELEPKLEISEFAKGAMLVTQGSDEMEQFFILEGILKRVVGNSEGKEMILRLAAETDMDTSYAAWRLQTPTPYSIVALTHCRVARLPMETWVEFIEDHGEVKKVFEYEVMRLMSEVMAHTITLHLLDAPGRLARFERKHAALVERIPKKELAAYLNITPETLSRVKTRR
ncbi:MAG: Crp/Fnr family transcriptional regulator [Burkholderiales bacterium]|nr:Crp/Fnr family transcriptional regulator [Burkholderiales bacterium]